MKADVALEDLAEKEEGEYCAPLEQAADRKVLLDALGRISREERQIVLQMCIRDRLRSQKPGHGRGIKGESSKTERNRAYLRRHVS